jgi:hypothetical protein
MAATVMGGEDEVAATWETMCALRIYFRGGSCAIAKGFWQRLFGASLTTHLLRRALEAGVTHAALNRGETGYATGATTLFVGGTEACPAAMPVCLELVARKETLERFAREQAPHLAAATLVMWEGIRIKPLRLDR